MKIETLQRLGKLLNVPLVALLGIEIEFVSDGYIFFRAHPADRKPCAIDGDCLRSDRLYADI